MRRSYEFWVPEGSYKSHEIGCVMVADETSVVFSLSKKGGYRNPAFAVSDAGCLLVSGDLDRETRDAYDLRLTGKRKSGGGVPATADVTVRLLDVNDNAPQFRNHHGVRKLSAGEIGLRGFEGELTVPVYEAAVLSEGGGAAGTVVARIAAEDPDGPDDGHADVRYGLFGPGAERFHVDAATGVVTLRGPLSGGVYNVTVVASDSAGHSSRKDNAALLVVSVADHRGAGGGGGPGAGGADEPPLELRYFEVEVEENCLVPLEILRLNVTARFRRLAPSASVGYSIVPSENSDSFE